MLSSNKYTFKKFDTDVKNKFIVYGDNLEESTQIIDWLYDFNKDKMKLKSIEYKSLSEYIYVFEINNKDYYFVAQAYYRNGRLPLGVRQVIKELDKPDAVVYSADEDKVIMGFEVTSTTMAGNATWQRTGRVINFMEKKVPFGFLAYFSKNDKSNTNVNKKPRVPSALFVLLFNMLSLKYSTPALVGFFEHPDKNQNIDALNPNEDWRENIFKYLLCLIEKEDGTSYLENCYKSMKNYYFDENKIEHTFSEFGSDALTYMQQENFEKKIIEDMNNNVNIPFFSKNSLSFEWKPKKISEIVKDKFPDIPFYQLSKNCKAGITFKTKELIEILQVGKRFYVEDLIKDINAPTVIIPVKLTKNEHGELIHTDDPYNGEIPAFSNLYLQSFPDANIMLLLCDHTNRNEYDVESAKGRKVYKAINKYADLVIDLDLNSFSRESENSGVENISRYENTFTTEDDVTSFFGTILLREGIDPSFLQPPCGSWSDIKLYPTDKYYYYNRNDERGDIAFFNKDEEIYYIGESKKNYSTLALTLDREYEKTKKLSDIILKELDYQYPCKLFAIFKGTTEEAKKVLENSDFDYVVTVSDDDLVTLEIIGKDI